MASMTLNEQMRRIVTLFFQIDNNYVLTLKTVTQSLVANGTLDYPVAVLIYQPCFCQCYQFFHLAETHTVVKQQLYNCPGFTNFCDDISMLCFALPIDIISFVADRCKIYHKLANIVC